jgi:hypothetical protein
VLYGNIVLLVSTILYVEELPHIALAFFLLVLEISLEVVVVVVELPAVDVVVQTHVTLFLHEIKVKKIIAVRFKILFFIIRFFSY